MKKNTLKVAVAAMLLLFTITLRAQSWSTAGNAGTDPTVNFLGTKDHKSIVFRTANIERMRITTNGNFGFGTSTPSGKFHIDSANPITLTSGGYLILGAKEGYNIGFDYSQIQARYKRFAANLYLNDLGGTVYAGNLSGSNYGLVTYGSINSITGYSSGSGSTGISGTAPSDGFGVAGSGYYGIYGYTSSGGYGVYGHGAFASYGVEGYSVQSIGVYGATGNSSSYAGFFVGSVYTTGTYQSSDEKLKQNIQDFSSATDIISQLHPKKYEYKQDGNYKQMNLPAGIHYGLIAQDLEKVLPGLVKNSKFDLMKNAPRTMLSAGKDSNEKTEVSIPTKSGEAMDFKAVNYTELIPIIIKGMQEQQQTIQDLKNKNNQLQQQINNLKQMGLSNSNASNAKALTDINSAYLMQNAPNPFNENSAIRCFVPIVVKQAQLIIYNMSGQPVKTFFLKTGTNNIAVSAANLLPGEYKYSLFIDGKKVDSKSMTLIK